MAELVCGICLAIALAIVEHAIAPPPAGPVDEQTFERSVEFEQQEWERRMARNGET